MEEQGPEVGLGDAELKELRQVIDSCPALVASLDRHRHYRFANRAYLYWFGLDPDQVEGHHIREIIGEEAYQTILGALDQAYAGESARYDGWVPYQPMGPRYISGRYMPRFAEDGSVAGITLLVLDRSEEQRARVSMEAAHQHTRGILDTAADAIITIDGRGLIRSFNPAAERMFGYRAGEVLGRNVSLLMPSPDHEHHDDYIRHYLEGGKARVIGTGREVRGMHRNGETMPLQLSVGEFEGSGQRQFVGILHDISRLRRAEEDARVRLDELARAERMQVLSELAGGIAHELSHPLTAIGARAEAARSQVFAAGRNGEMKALEESLEVIVSQTERAGRILRSMREMVGGNQEKVGPESLNAIVEDVVVLLGHEIRRNGVRCRKVLDPELPHVTVDRVQIEQILVNLLRNAVEAMMDQQGKRELTVVSRRDGDSLHLEVRDSGPGISEANQAHLFQPFFTTKAAGLGQGLPLCASLARRNGATLEARSTPGHGASFTLVLPVDRTVQRQEARG